ncbi:MAG: antibiotic ABC transporter ATP-binding protein [Flavobacteriales bacterium]|nr:antibiotic ABC transporter ATP-binding protein [Flavobacteriales bacterium]|tara:strand:- start:2300 stop:4123 length:1824 start_codon:yes stop_codon:yes gene_type:complete
MKDFFRILKYAKRYYIYAILNIVFNILTVFFSLVSLTMAIPFLGLLFGTIEVENIQPDSFSLTPESIKDHFYFEINTIIESGEKLDALFFICALILITFFFRNLFRYLSLYFLTPIRNGVVHDLRTNLHKKVISLPIGFFTEKRRGDITSRMTTDLVEIEWSIMSSLEMIFRDPLQIIIYLITLIILSPQLTLFVILLFPITGFIIAKIGKSLKKSSEKSQGKMGDILSVLDENIGGLKVIKLFNSEKNAHNKFNRESKKYQSLMTSLLRKKDMSSPMSEFLSTIIMVIVMWFGGKLVLGGDSLLSAEEFIGYILIFSQIIPPAKSFTTAYYRLQKGAAASARVYKLMDAENNITDAENPISINKIAKKVSINNVSFRYENTTIINKISFSISKGKTIAIVGKSGSGKSTIADLCARFYDINEGEICIDNTNIKDIKISDLRQLMGVVSQESILFNDTIYNNILIGNPKASKEEVIEASQIANAEEFILESELGYDTNIGEKGDKLSGGQKQRISIARAILKNPDFLILDEATSSLDTQSEKLVQNALSNLMRERTTLVIAHRLSTIKDADEIIVLHKGRIVERGNHTELVKLGGHYKQLIDLQNIS